MNADLYVMDCKADTKGLEEQWRLVCNEFEVCNLVVV